MLDKQINSELIWSTYNVQPGTCNATIKSILTIKWEIWIYTEHKNCW